jgi:hypothetical protein
MKAFAMRSRALVGAAGLLLAGLTACTQEEGAATADSPYRITATIQDIMDAQVDPAADAIWNSVASIITTAGVEEKQPRTDEEWEEIRLQAILVLEGANLLAMPGRQIVEEGKPLDPGELAGETAEDMQKAIETNRAAWIRLAQGLHDASMGVIRAIEAKDVMQLISAGEVLDTACENCHSTFWYPNAPPRLEGYDAPSQPDPLAKEDAK